MANTFIPLHFFSFMVLLFGMCQAQNWQDGNNGQVKWAPNCDFPGYDIGSVAVPSEQCGGQCLSNSQCTHFTWYYNICLLKRATNPGVNSLGGAVCGFVVNRGSGGGGLSGGVGTGGGGNVKTTYYGEEDAGGGCQMPDNANYLITDALALGQSTALGNLAFRSGLCGQVLTLNCGNGAVDAVVVDTCGIGSTSCGVDLIGKTWRKLTNNQPPGVAQCSVTLSNRNPIAGGAPMCYHQPGSDINNLWYAALGVLNTGGRISKSATLAGVSGRRGVGDHWFQFNSGGLFTGGASVVFQFEDGSSASFKLQDCINGGNVHTFIS